MGKKPAADASETVDPGIVARSYVNPTPVGDLKSMDEPMEPAYKPHAVEASWNDWWELNGYYRGESSPEDRRPKFSICLPPPNVTGSLHLGHALTVAVQDLLCRWHKMRGFNVLWIPGTDHAGIATQVVVEKKLWKERGQTRHDLGRDNFVSEVHKWKDQYGANICRQLRRLGCSLDWSREVFTMDEARAKSVTAAFIQFHKDGLIYRDVRLTNWCCQVRARERRRRRRRGDAGARLFTRVNSCSQRPWAVDVCSASGVPRVGAPRDQSPRVGAPRDQSPRRRATPRSRLRTAFAHSSAPESRTSRWTTSTSRSARGWRCPAIRR